MLPPDPIVATEQQLRAWRERRAEVALRVQELTTRGICYQCEDRRTGGAVLGPQAVIVEDDRIRVVLALDPRAPGHTIVVWLPHTADFTGLTDGETGRLFTACRRVAVALQRSLVGVERVYQVTMCDGPVNHLHVQLIPRYAGTAIGSQRLVDPRGPLVDGERIAARVRGALT